MDPRENYAGLAGKHGIYNLSGCQVSRHASQRFHERFQGNSETFDLDQTLSDVLRSCRKLGVKQDGTSAYIAVHGDDPVVIVEHDQVILTFMTQNQFETVMADFGRNRWPRKPGRWLSRIKQRSAGKSKDDPPV